MILSKNTSYIFIILCIKSAFINAADAVCQSDLGGACENAYSDAECAIIFDTAPNDSAVPKTVDPDCLTVANFAVKSCAARCLACCKTPAYDCIDLVGGLPISCDDARKANLCSTTDTVIKQQLTKFCPHSCGLCMLSSLTCNDLDPILCKGKRKECAINKEFMLQLCPKTCGNCTNSGGGSGTCVDSNANCVQWARHGFCKNTFYSDAQKRGYCAKSCNLCI